MNPILLDTHVWIGYANGNEQFNHSSRKMIASALKHHALFVADISLWEVSILEKENRIILEMSCLEWIRQVLSLTHIVMNFAIMTHDKRMIDYGKQKYITVFLA